MSRELLKQAIMGDYPQLIAAVRQYLEQPQADMGNPISPMTDAQFEKLCALLPPDVSWGDSLTPAVVQGICDAPLRRWISANRLAHHRPDSDADYDLLRQSADGIVLEGAANEAASFASVTYNSWHIAEAIRALEVSHEL